QPTIADIIQVKDLFSRISTPLPIELVDKILDDASYWPYSSITLDLPRSVPGSRHYNKDDMYMRTLPLAGGESYDGRWLPPRGEHPCRMIEFQLWSRDQGFSHEIHNHGTYRGSYTWFDAGVESLKSVGTLDHNVSWPVYLITEASDSERLAGSPFQFTDPGKHPFLPPPTHLQRNIHAKSEMHHHTVVWHYLDCVEEGSSEAVEAELRGQGWKSLDGSFVRGLKVGDCITLWLRARFPAWAMRAAKAKMDIYWAV
ncbi:hypothetical protein BV22DRAFT_969693, partial [Leucogyrophana mollusca]